jgi:hypothetical protein
VLERIPVEPDPGGFAEQAEGRKLWHAIREYQTAAITAIRLVLHRDTSADDIPTRHPAVQAPSRAA